MYQNPLYAAGASFYCIAWDIAPAAHRERGEYLPYLVFLIAQNYIHRTTPKSRGVTPGSSCLFIDDVGVAVVLGVRAFSAVPIPYTEACCPREAAPKGVGRRSNMGIRHRRERWRAIGIGLSYRKLQLITRPPLSSKVWKQRPATPPIEYIISCYTLAGVMRRRSLTDPREICVQRW